ncbi:MAG: chromosomal replication initiator protein DnaA [Deltaproteobacteria bacterium]|nr:chromosomal replication initiator protein DnaA [Deltaproteobacteria bacterium]MBW2076975.1 chromosomal replication initiator protein DnaA [Deltaproteobacteria bacterium]
MEAAWKQVREVLKEVMDEKSYTFWIKPLKLLDSDERVTRLGCPNRFFRNWITENYSALFHRQFSQLGLKDHRITFKVLPHRDLLDFKPHGDNGNGKQLLLPNIPIKARAGGRYLLERFNFDSFVVGESNEFAYSVSKALANDASCPYSSLLLLSQTGLGKSHLAQAIGNSILKKKPTLRVRYITAEEFTNEMIFALKNNLIDQFKTKYRRDCDVLLLEELHFLSGKEKTQVELGYTLDALFTDGKKVIFTSSLPLEEIPNMKKMLTSRLSSGVLTSIEKPGFQTRLDILKQKAAERSISLPDEVACYLAENLMQDIRQLEGALVSLEAISFFMKKEINLNLARETLKQILPAKPLVTIKEIQAMVCKYFKVDLVALKSKSRKKFISYPRSVAIYLCREYTESSLEGIGRSFNRNHSTVLYDYEKIKKNIRIDESVRKEVEFLCRKIEDRPV